MLGIPVKHLLHKKAFPIVEEEKLTWCSECCWKSHRCLFSAKWTYSSEPDISAHHTYVGASSWRDSTRLSISESQHVTVRLLSLTDWNLTFGIRSPSLMSRGPLGNLFLTFHEMVYTVSASHCWIWRTFSIKNWIINILGFMGHAFSFATTQFWPCRGKAALGDM